MFRSSLSPLFVHCACVQDDRTPLHNACGRGHTKCAELLLQAGADVDKGTKVNHNLHTAASSLFLSVVCNVCHCPSMSVPGQWLKRLAIILHRAWVVVAHFETLTGAWQGWFVLKRSCVGHLIIITTICELCVQDGRTPLFIACEENFPECVKLLLQAGADADKADSRVNHIRTQPLLQFFFWGFALSGTFHQCQCLANYLNVWQSSFIVHELW